MSGFTEVKWVALKNHHGCYLSWAPGGDCRANETNLRTEEKWLMFRNPKTNTCKFGKPIGHGLYQYMSSAGDKKVNCKASWPVGTEWQMEVHSNKYAFKAVGYVTNRPLIREIARCWQIVLKWLNGNSLTCNTCNTIWHEDVLQ